jgi:hypothetical protein
MDGGSHLDVLGLEALDGRPDSFAGFTAVPKTPEGQRRIKAPGRL